jgi:hypothetical protein
MVENQGMTHRRTPPRPANAVLARLDALIGTWTMEASVGGTPIGARATTELAWLEGGAFVVQHTDLEPSDEPLPPGWRENAPFPVTSLLGLDDATGQFTMLYADGRGVLRVYQMALDAGVWTIWRDAPGFFQRFTATFGDGGRRIAGRWEGSPDGTRWSTDFEVTYSKHD